MGKRNFRHSWPTEIISAHREVLFVNNNFMVSYDETHFETLKKIFRLIVWDLLMVRRPEEEKQTKRLKKKYLAGLYKKRFQ